MQQSPESQWPLDPRVIFLNHGSYGSCPYPVQNAQDQLREQMEARPVEFLGRHLEELLDQARFDLSSFINCPNEDLAFVPNATYGVNSILRSMDFQPGDEILVTDHEYNACLNVVDFVARRAQVKVVVAKLPFPLQAPEEITQAVLSKVTKRTKVALLDYVTSPTGLVLPLADLIPQLRELGVRTLVDGAHAPGMLDLNLKELDADYFTGNCHKWVNAPKGAALLYVRPDLQGEVRPACISHGANSSRQDRSLFLQEFDWTGTIDPTAILSIPAALQFVEENVEGGWNSLREHNHQLALSARALLLKAMEIPAPAPDSMIASMVSLPLASDPDQLVEALSGWDPLQAALRDQFHIEIPVTAWGQNSCGQPHRAIRLSAQIYNRIEDYQSLAAALVDLGVH
jgi:isopenicillin-N epimerase